VAGRCCGLDRGNADDRGIGSLDAVTGRAVYALSRRHLPLEHPATRRPEMGGVGDVRGRRAGPACRHVATARARHFQGSGFALNYSVTDSLIVGVIGRCDWNLTNLYGGQATRGSGIADYNQF
jgi:hypothetical protein